MIVKAFTIEGTGVLRYRCRDRQAPSAWTEHMPFAFWLVDGCAAASTIVELGSHNGVSPNTAVSYSAMSQAKL
jgi:hypothetical protein